MISSAPELVRFRTRTADPEEAHDFLKKAYANHEPTLSGDRENFRFGAEGAQEIRFGVEHFRHSMALQTDIDPFDALILSHVRRGRLSMANRRTELTVRAGEVALIGANDRHRASWDAIDMAVVRLSVEGTQEIAAELTNTPGGRVRFDLTAPIDQAHAAHFLGIVNYINTSVLESPTVADNPLIRTQAFRMLAVAALTAFPNSTMADDVSSAPASHAPAAVVRAIAFIDTHAGEDITVHDIAAAAHVSPRTLQLAFRRHRGTTPTAYLRQVRLHRAHAELRAGEPNLTTVAQIAHRWGFLHGGHFARLYRQEFDCLPQETLAS